MAIAVLEEKEETEAVDLPKEDKETPVCRGIHCPFHNPSGMHHGTAIHMRDTIPPLSGGTVPPHLRGTLPPLGYTSGRWW